MQLLISYDVSTSSEGGTRRLRRVAKICLDFGQRVQNSVFECKVDYSQYVMMKQKLLNEIDLEKDSIRFYNLGKEWDSRVEHYGVKPSLNPNGSLIV